MLITSKPFKGKRQIFIDDKYFMTISSDFWYSCSFNDGDEISECELASLKCEADSRCAYMAALRILTVRMNSKKELYDKLIRKFDNEAVDFAVNKCQELGFIDDKAFAELFALELYKRKAYAPKRIVSELISKGISKEKASYAVEALDINSQLRIIELLNSKFSGKIEDDKAIKKTFQSLIRLGYDYYDINNAFRELDIRSVYDES